MNSFRRVFSRYRALWIVAGLVALTTQGQETVEKNAQLPTPNAQRRGGEDPGLGTGQRVTVTSLITDPLFANGFEVKGLGYPVDDGATKTTFAYGKTGVTPFWRLAQWGSRYGFHDPACTTFIDRGNGVYCYQNTSKILEVDTSTGELTLNESASVCYERPRKNGEEWPHILIEARLTDTKKPEPASRISTLQSLRVTLDARLTKFVDKMDGQANPNMDAGHFLMFLTIQNLTKGDDGFRDMIWFGLPIFDNRKEFVAENGMEDGGKLSASHKFIYHMPTRAFLGDCNSFWRDGAIVAGPDAPWVTVDSDVLPFVSKAFKMAQDRGFLAKTTWDDLYVSGMNLGWELPGTYDVEMKVRKLAVEVK